jgi:hypothetical protein
MGPLSESNFGLGISEIFEFRSIGNRGISSRNLIFGNLGISVPSLFLVQVNNGYGTNSNHIRIKKPPLTRGTAGPEFPFRNSRYVG